MKIITYEIQNVDIKETQHDDGTITIYSHSWDTGRSMERDYLASQGLHSIYEHLAEHNIDIAGAKLFHAMAESAEVIFED